MKISFDIEIDASPKQAEYAKYLLERVSRKLTILKELVCVNTFPFLLFRLVVETRPNEVSTLKCALYNSSLEYVGKMRIKTGEKIWYDSLFEDVEKEEMAQGILEI